MANTTQEQLTSLVTELTTWLKGRSLDAALGDELNRVYSPRSAFFRELAGVCTTGLEMGWLGDRGAPPLRYGRAIKASPATNGFSIDVVLMSDIVGPQHMHPNGEIDMVVPIDPGARFDGNGAGWVVFSPGTSHAPTVIGGTAAVLYALPDGAIRF
jgi:hypothetical protein